MSGSVKKQKFKEREQETTIPSQISNNKKKDNSPKRYCKLPKKEKSFVEKANQTAQGIGTPRKGLRSK